MGNCGGGGGESPEERERNETSKRIDRHLKDVRKQLTDEVKILLLGPGESGKSTIFKQCKIIQDSGGYSDSERAVFAPIVVHNVLSQMAVLLNQSARLGHELTAPEDLALAQTVLSAGQSSDTLSPALAKAVKDLWAHPNIQATYALRDKKFSLNDSTSYFFESIDRIAEPNYLPSVDDVLRARVRSTGIEEAEFDFGELSFRMFDVGGQRSERRKWIHCFEKVTAVLFVISLCGYDQVLREDETQNCMKESVLLFDEIVNSAWFANTSFILFLNKLDLFETKIKDSPLSACYPDYTGGPDPEAAAEYIKDKFVKLRSEKGPKREIFHHKTCAIDSKQIAIVFAAVKRTILMEVLGEFGVYN